MKKILLSILLVTSILSTSAFINENIIIQDIEAVTVKLNATNLTLMNIRSYTLKVKNTKKKVTWSSSNKKIATVSSKGLVKAVKNGTCYVYAKVGSKKLKCKVTVKTPTNPTSVKLNKTSLSLTVGSSSTLKATLNPTNVKNKTLKWSSSNKAVATVSSSGKVTAKKAGTATITVTTSNKKKATCKVTIKSQKKYVIDIPTYSQHKNGYPKGCEGVSLYMCLRGKKYAQNLTLQQFMNTMPKSDDDPNLGFVGDPTKDGSASVNIGKRTTINPEPLAKWGSEYGKVVSLQGVSVTQLKTEIKKGNPIVVYMTSGWNTPKWKTYAWGKEVTNNHAICLVGYNESTGEYLVNDCGKNLGTYWVQKNKFENIYNARKYAVVVR